MKNKLRTALVLLFVLSLFTNPCLLYPQSKETAVDLDFKDSDIRDVARAFSRVAAINIIVSDEVKAKVTLRVQDMQWREALNMILSAYNLIAVDKGNYIIITTFERRRITEESGDLKTDVVTLNFVNVEDTQKTLNSMLTKRGKIEIDQRTNSLVITDVPDKIGTIKEIATRLDTKTPQVMIEAMMMTIKLNNDESLGINWDITHKTRPERTLTQDLAMGGAAGTNYFWQLTYGKTLLSWANLSATIQLLLEQKKAEILANPRVLTLDNLTATIDLTEQVPYTQQSDSTQSANSITSIQFKDVPIKLYVKPHITKDNHIFMNIKTEQTYVSTFITDTQGVKQPQLDSRKAETNVMVNDGETVVIGGLRKKEDSVTVDKVPVLGDLPLLGFLFRKTVKVKLDTELIIFVTPRIAKDFTLAQKEAEFLDRFKRPDNELKKGFLTDAMPYPMRSPKDMMEDR